VDFLVVTMPNEFATTSSTGILKEVYDTGTPLQEALKRKLKKLADTKREVDSSEKDEDRD